MHLDLGEGLLKDAEILRPAAWAIGNPVDAHRRLSVRAGLCTYESY